MESRRTTTTKDIKEAYEKNIGFYIPGYGHVTNFKNFYDNELAGQVSMKTLTEGARTDPQFVETIDRLRNSTIKSYNSGGTSAPELIRTDRQTKNGRTVYQLDGKDVSELTVTFQNDDGKWVNAPSLNFGKIYNEEDVKKMYSSKGDIVDLETGRVLPKFDSVEAATKAARAESNSLSSNQTRPTFAERFRQYQNIAEADALNLLSEYEQVSKQIEKDTPNRYGSFKETFAAERRRAIKEGTLDSHTFEYTDPKTGNKGVYHARTVKEQANWLKKRREQDA